MQPNPIVLTCACGISAIEVCCITYYYSDNSQNPPYSPFAKGGNCYPPLWPPAHRASDPEGKEGRGEIF